MKKIPKHTVTELDFSSPKCAIPNSPAPVTETNVGSVLILPSTKPQRDVDALLRNDFPRRLLFLCLHHQTAVTVSSSNTSALKVTVDLLLTA